MTPPQKIDISVFRKPEIAALLTAQDLVDRGKSMDVDTLLMLDLAINLGAAGHEYLSNVAYHLANESIRLPSRTPNA